MKDSKNEVKEASSDLANLREKAGLIGRWKACNKAQKADSPEISALRLAEATISVDLVGKSTLETLDNLVARISTVDSEGAEITKKAKKIIEDMQMWSSMQCYVAELKRRHQRLVDQASTHNTNLIDLSTNITLALAQREALAASNNSIGITNRASKHIDHFIVY